MRTTFHLLICLWLGFAAPAFSQQFTLSNLMGSGDQNAIGINRLSPNEQQALEAWVNLWTIKTINHVIAKGCGCTAQECMNSLYQTTAGGASFEPQPRANPEIYEERQDFYERRQDVERDHFRPQTSTEKIEHTDYQLITDILRAGGLIRLNNGTVWEVVPTDQAISQRWQRRDKVQLRPGNEYGQYSLINLSLQQQVQVAHPGQALRLDPFLGDTYRKAITKTVRDNVNQGALIILDDGTTFEVRLSDRGRISRTWDPGSVVQVTKKGGAYPYSLLNAATGDSVEARLK